MPFHIRYFIRLLAFALTDGSKTVNTIPKTVPLVGDRFFARAMIRGVFRFFFSFHLRPERGAEEDEFEPFAFTFRVGPVNSASIVRSALSIARVRCENTLAAAGCPTLLVDWMLASEILNTAPGKRPKKEKIEELGGRTTSAVAFALALDVTSAERS